VDVNVTIFITTVVALTTVNLGTVYFIAARLGSQIDGMGGRIDALSARIDALDERLSGRIDGLSGRIDGLSGRIDTLTDTVASMGSRIGLLEEHRPAS
jgi:hypothetical protein